MLTRIRLDGGHAEIALAGIRYLPDESGAFEVPSEYASALIAMHGGKVDPGIQGLENLIIDIRADLGALKARVELKTEELKSAEQRLADYKAAQARPQNGGQQTLTKPNGNNQQNQNNGQRR